MRLILEAGQLPLGTVVCKPTGSEKYTLRNEIRVHGLPGLESIMADDETLFLVAEDGAINAVSNKSRVAIDGTAGSLAALLHSLPKNYE